MSYYSPFTDKNGKLLDIFQIKHYHLNQLQSKSICEGYQVEYKSTFAESVKAKIPKIVTSFANSSGGWLFIGVDEKTLNIDRLEKERRTDYSQIISQLLREHTSPLPRFEARFLKAKGSSSGVLVIYIYEGNNPPYIADGTVYVRNGSSSEPAKSQRAEIDALYQKRKDFDLKVSEFCKREIYYPMDDHKSNQVVLCNIYMLNVSPASPTMPLTQIAKELMSISPNQFHNYIFSNDSVVFQNSKAIGQFQIGIVFEVFNDCSVKMHIPIQVLDSCDRDSAVECLRRVSGQQFVDEFLLLDGYSFCLSFQYIVQQYYTFLRNQDTNMSSFLYQMSLENAENSILYFDSEPFTKYVKEHDIPYCCKCALKTPVKYHKDYAKKDGNYDFIDLLLDAFYMFGLNPIDAAKMYLAAMKANPMRNLRKE